MQYIVYFQNIILYKMFFQNTHDKNVHEL